MRSILTILRLINLLEEKKILKRNGKKLIFARKYAMARVTCDTHK